MTQHAVPDYDLATSPPVTAGRGWIGFGIVWATALLMAGFWLWDQQGEIIQLVARFVETESLRPVTIIARLCAVWTIAAAEFVFMVYVADAMFPRTPLVLRGFLKMVAGILVFLCLIAIAFLLAGLLP